MKNKTQLLSAKGLFAGIILILLTLHFVLYVFCADTQQKDLHENKANTKLPDFNTMGLKEYLPKLEQYLSDHFILKYAYITPVSTFRSKVFQYTNPNIKVVTGKDGWLFYNCTHFNDKGLDEYCGLNPLSRPQLDQLIRNINTLKVWCQKQGICFVPLICPNKQCIYGEFLPERYTKTGPDTYEQLMQADTSLINLQSVFLNMKKKSPYTLYYKTDTHWNELGGFLACAEVVKLIHRTHDSLPVWGLDDISISQKSGLTSMDLYSMLAFKEPVRETWTEAKLNKPNAHKLHKVFVIRDSFYKAMAPFMNQLFEVSADRFVLTEPLHAQEILDAKPDVFILELVERNEFYLLNNLDPGFLK